MPTFKFDIPLISGTGLHLSLSDGESLFMLGANGTGKSSLMQRLFTMFGGQAIRISAHRQTWFTSGSVAFSGEQKRQTEQNMLGQDQQLQARWQDNYAHQRPSIAIFDMVDAQNIRARAIADAVDQQNLALAQALSIKEAPVPIINDLLKQSNLPIEIEIAQSENITARRHGGQPYSIAELSDGERNAILIAASVLTAKPRTLILIDEPERHLHRSIISPLLTLLFARRPDCCFIVSTHELMLPVDNGISQTLLVRSCLYAGSQPQSWDIDLLPAGGDLDEELQRDILGSRRIMLFVEGTGSSLDKALYSLVFPMASVISKTGCRDVEQAVAGIRASESVHWVRAFGIVDGDNRSTTELAQLQAAGVYAPKAYSVESIYYHPEVQRRIAVRQQAVDGQDAAARLSGSTTSVIAEIRKHAARLACGHATRRLREQVFSQLPSRKSVEQNHPVNIQADTATAVQQEVSKLTTLLDQGDVEALICSYPVREAGVIGSIVSQLGFKNRSLYEAAVRKLVIDDAETLVFVRGLFGTLYGDLLIAAS